MKKHTLLAALVAMSALCFAQTKPSVGIRGGLSHSGMQGDAVNSLQELLDYTNNKVTTSNRTGFFGGVNVNIPVSDQFSVEPALYYTQKGYEMKGELNVKGADFLGMNARAQLTTHYIDLPVLLKGNFNGFQVFAGPQLSYLPDAKLRTTAGLLGFNVFKREMDATEEFNRWDAGITGGIGFQFKNGANIRAAYDHGLSRVDANKNTNAYNRSIKIGIGFNF